MATESGIVRGIRAEAGQAAVWVAGLTLLAAALRFGTLDLQSYWSDEAVTVACFLEPGLTEALGELPDSERTPPLYYVLAWSWAQVFGTGEVAVRSLSALVGTAVVPVAYLAGAQLLSRRAGVIAAAIVAVHPLLIWYSQEARAYSLLVLLGSLSFLFFVRALDRPSRAELALWALASALAVATHYFAVFLVAAEAVVLLARRGRAALGWIAGVAAVALALLPLALEQEASATTDFISDVALGQRLRDLVGSFLVGEVGTQLPLAKVAIALLAAAAGALLLARAGGRERQGALLAAAIGTVAVALPLAAAILGVDYFIARNVIAALPPLSIVVAAGLAAAPSRTLRVAAPAALCGLLAAVWIAVLVDSDRHRTDWRALSGELGDPSGPRALLADAGAGARTLKVYRPEVRALPVDGERVRELVLLGEADLATAAPPSLDGWRLVDTASVQKLSFARYRSPRPIRVAPSATLPPPFPSERAKSLIEMQSAPGAQDIPEPGFCRGDWAERGTATIVGEEGDRANAQLRQSTPGSSHRRYPG